MFCRYCHHQTRMIVGDPFYEIDKTIKQIRKVSCYECNNFLHNAIKKYKKSTPVNLITGVFTNAQIKKLKSERARVNRIVKYIFLRPQLRCYKIGTTTMINGDPQTIENSEYEMIEDTPINRNYHRYRAFESMYFTNRHGKRLRKSKPIEFPEKERVWCNQQSRLTPTDDQANHGLFGTLHKHGMEKLEDHAFGMGTKTKARVCVEGRYEKAGIEVRKGKEVLTQKWVEAWREFVPIDTVPATDITANANLDEIRYCGFSLCPNRYGYITRPQILKEVFAK